MVLPLVLILPLSLIYWWDKGWLLLHPPQSRATSKSLLDLVYKASSTLTTTLLPSQSHEAVGKDTAEIIEVPCSTVPQTFTDESLVQYSQLDFAKTKAVKVENLKPKT